MRGSAVLLIIGAGILSGGLGPARAAIYAFTDEQGTVHYSNVPSDPRYRLVIASPPGEADGKASLTVLLEKSRAFTPAIERAARANGVDPALVRAVIVAESACDPKATSKRGARGLMQLMPETARAYGVRNAFDPEQNIHAGTRYLRDLARRYENDWQLVLAAYNAGPEAVDARGGHIPPWKETLDYVPRVLRIYHRLVEATGSG